MENQIYWPTWSLRELLYLLDITPATRPLRPSLTKEVLVQYLLHAYITVPTILIKTNKALHKVHMRHVISKLKMVANSVDNEESYHLIEVLFPVLDKLIFPTVSEMAFLLNFPV